jgi:hypothetical protein
MIKAFLLLVDSSRTWEKIKNDQHTVGRISASFILPLLLLTCAAEGAGLMRLGMEHGTLTKRVVKVPDTLVLRYEATHFGLSLLIAYLGALVLQKIGATFHRRHTYRECFTTLAYSLSPLFLLRILDGVPAMNTWVCYGIGIFLSLSLFYRGIPFVMRPDPSNALGLFIFCSFVLIFATALAHFFAVLTLDARILTNL